MKVKFRKQIHGCFAAVSSLDRWLERVVEFPEGLFPQVGMEIVDGEWGATIESLAVWLDRDPQVEAWVAPDKTLYDSELGRWSKEDTPSLDDIVTEWLDSGWVERGK